MPLWRRAGRGETAVLKPRAPPSERLPSRRRSRRAARRRAQPVGAPFTPVESADRSVDGVEVLEGPRHPRWRTLRRQQQVRRGPVPGRSAAALGVRRSW
jgi:hypothetical protein